MAPGVGGVALFGEVDVADLGVAVGLDDDEDGFFLVGSGFDFFHGGEELLLVVDGFVVNFCDEVADVEGCGAEGGGGAVFDECDHDTLGVLGQTAGVSIGEDEVACDDADLCRERMRLLTGEFGRGSEGDGDIDCFSIAQHAEGDFVAGLVFFENAGKVLDHHFGNGVGGEGFSVDGEDDVLRLDATFVSGFVGDDGTDHDAGGLLDFTERADVLADAGEAVDGEPSAVGLERRGGDIFEDGGDLVGGIEALLWSGSRRMMGCPPRPPGSRMNMASPVAGAVIPTNLPD